jgi:hypothetical protein
MEAALKANLESSPLLHSPLERFSIVFSLSSGQIWLNSGPFEWTTAKSE